MLLQSTKPDRKQSNAEDGYLLLTVLVMVFLLLLALSVVAPKVAKEIQRDKEQEAVQRGLQYRRAIQLYYKKFGAYPGDIKQLEKTNEIRFLRKRYKDPITGQDDWRLCLAAAVAPTPTRNWLWLNWLPHARPTTPPLSGPHVATDACGVTAARFRLGLPHHA